jgi:hypothetical protein
MLSILPHHQGGGVAGGAGGGGMNMGAGDEIAAGIRPQVGSVVLDVQTGGVLEVVEVGGDMHVHSAVVGEFPALGRVWSQARRPRRV